MAAAPRALGTVTIQGKAGTYTTLTDAMAAAEDGDVLLVAGSVSESATVEVTHDVTLKSFPGDDGAIVSTANVGIQLASGKSLTMGGDDCSLSLVMETPASGGSTGLRVTDGTINYADGARIWIKSTSTYQTGIYMGGLVNGSITGGEVRTPDNLPGAASTDAVALRIHSGTHLDTIAGGYFYGYTTSLTAYDEDGTGTAIDSISANFTSTSSARCTVYIQNDAHVGKISGGYFLANAGPVLAVLRGGTIDTISGGDFLALPSGDPVNLPNRALVVATLMDDNGLGHEYGTASVGTISGGTFKGDMALYTTAGGGISTR